jgi:hypothetical protein
VADAHKGLDVEEEHPKHVVIRLIELEKVRDGVLEEQSGNETRRPSKWTYHRCRERAVQPPPTLADELDRSLRDIRLSLAGLDIRQGPLGALLRDELETEDPILGQEHVLRENAHAVNALGSETIRERVVAVEVLLQRAAEDRLITVCGESTGQHGHVAKAALERLV